VLTGSYVSVLALLHQVCVLNPSHGYPQAYTVPKFAHLHNMAPLRATRYQAVCCLTRGCQGPTEGDPAPESHDPQQTARRPISAFHNRIDALGGRLVESDQGLSVSGLSACWLQRCPPCRQVEQPHGSRRSLLDQGPTVGGGRPLSGDSVNG